jgi:hypothetical protein
MSWNNHYLHTESTCEYATESSGSKTGGELLNLQSGIQDWCIMRKNVYISHIIFCYYLWFTWSQCGTVLSVIWVHVTNQQAFLTMLFNLSHLSYFVHGQVLWMACGTSYISAKVTRVTVNLNGFFKYTVHVACHSYQYHGVTQVYSVLQRHNNISKSDRLHGPLRSGCTPITLTEIWHSQ